MRRFIPIKIEKHTITGSKRPHRRRLNFSLLCLGFVIASPLAMTDTLQPNTMKKSDENLIQLNGKEIVKAFGDVRDDARVQDAAGTRAVNHWYADGGFTSHWSSEVDSGKVTGTWRVEKDLRCITIATGLPQRVGKERCGSLFRRGNEYLSFNPDGSIHGIHTLSPLQPPQQ